MHEVIKDNFSVVGESSIFKSEPDFCAGNLSGGDELFLLISGQDEELRKKDEEIAALREENGGLSNELVFSNEIVEIFAKWLKQAREIGCKDSLTGCYNQNFFKQIKDMHTNPERNHKKFAAIFVDLNYLKETNDNFGYASGNRLLQETAMFLKSNKFRSDDAVFRIGGDEFVIICGNDKNDEFFENNIRARAAEVFANSPVSLASGIAVYDKYKDDSPDLDESERGFESMKNRAGFEMHKNKIQMKSLDI